MANTRVRLGAAWVPIGSLSVPLPPEPDPDPTPVPTPDPEPTPGTFTHGSQLAATSAVVASQIGPSGTLTPTSSLPTTGTREFENVEFSTVGWKPAAGSDITFYNSRIVGSFGQTTYTINATNGGGLRIQFVDCEFITRASTSSSPRCIAMWGDGNVKAVRTIFRGGIDNLYMNPSNSPGVWVTGHSLVPMARVYLSECWFGDLQRVSGSHTDCIQFDGGGYGYIERIRLMSYSLPSGADPLTTRITNPSTADLGGGGLIGTQNSSNPNRLSNIAAVDSWFDGGNYTVDLAPSDGIAPGPAVATGNLFGVRSRFGPLRLPGGSTNVNNRWGQSGTTQWASPITVTEGQLVPGSTGE